MRILILISLFIGVSFIGSADNQNNIPGSIDELFRQETPERLAADSAYNYLIQDRYAAQGDGSFVQLFKGGFNETPILIYMMYESPSTKDAHYNLKVYACTHPFVNRYPSSLLLWSYTWNQGVNYWYKIMDNVIYTYTICDYGELGYITMQAYTIIDGKFTQIESKKIDILSRDGWDKLFESRKGY